MSKIEKVLAALWASDLIEIENWEEVYPVNISDNCKFISDKDYTVKLEDKDKYFPPFYFTLKDLEQAEVESNKITIRDIIVAFYKLVPNKV